METPGKELTLRVVDRARRPSTSVAATVRVLISRPKMLEIVRRFRFKVGLTIPTWFTHMDVDNKQLLTTEGVACWYDTNGKRVSGGLMKDTCPISVRKEGTMNLYDVLRGQMVYSEPYPLAALLRDFNEPSDLVELPDNKLQPGQRQGAFLFAARPN